jgi:nucleotidyltransferase substrate binding protein (TIGR01987 family)
LKDLVAKPDHRDEKLVLTNSILMGRERFSERQAAVLNAAARLVEVAGLPETDIVRDAAIQRFEFTFELVWKTLQLYLEHEGLESGGPRAVLKRAFIIKLIPDQDEGDVWLQMLDDRNLTSHAYDEMLAVRIYTRIVHDYAPRLAQMAEKIQILRWD